MFSTGEQFKDNFKNSVYLRLYEVFATWSQWFIKHCDMEPLELTEDEVNQLITPFIQTIDEEAEIDE